MTESNILTHQDVLEALRLWHGGEVLRWPLAHLRLNFEVSKESKDLTALADDGPATQNRALLNLSLNNLKSRAPESEELLRERFEHRRDVLAVANSLNVSESSLYYRQRQAIQQLTEIILQLEINASTKWQEKMLTRLPPPTYQKLVGVEKPQEQLLSALSTSSSQTTVSIDGIGGLGKTALADQTARKIIKTNLFDDIFWITAKHTHLSSLGRLQIDNERPVLTYAMFIDKIAQQLDINDTTHLQRDRYVRQYLKETPCLVVIDNLETVADYRTLLPELQNLQNPSKFLLTSRIRLIQETGVFSVSLDELKLDDALKLMRNEAKQSGFTALIDAKDEDLAKIYHTVGGNPLALKLIVGQLRIHSLPRVLNRFAQKPKTLHQNEGIFDYIYREIWDALGEVGKATLLALTQAGDSGFSFDHLVAISGLAEEDVSRCLEELIQSSIVDLTGTLFERKYRLHRLTEVFLLRMLEG